MKQTIVTLKRIKTIALLAIILFTGILRADAQLVTDISGIVFNDANGNVVKDSGEPGLNSTGTRLYAYMVRNSTNLILDSAAVMPDGTFTFTSTALGTVPLTAVLSNTRYAIGTNVSTTPINKALPAGWYHTGERLGAAPDGVADGSLGFTMAGLSAGTITFGIQRVPKADAKSYLVSNTAFGKTPPAGFADISSPGDPWLVIPMNDASLTGYATAGSLSGSDPEGCAAASSCNTGTGTTFTIDSIYSNTRLFYDFGGATGVMEVDVTGGPFVISNYDVTKMVIWGQEGAGTTGNELGFTYAIKDAADTSGPRVSYIIATTLPLPVALLYFNAVRSDEQVQLDWATTTEQGNKGFEIERSTDARNWSLIGTVSSRSDKNDDGSKLEYNHIDVQPVPGNNLYRLKQIDWSGRYVYSPVRIVNYDQRSRISIAPNPARDNITISGLQGGACINVYDATGRLVVQQSAANTSVVISLMNRSEGIYYIRVTGATGTVASYRIVKL